MSSTPYRALARLCKEATGSVLNIGDTADSPHSLQMKAAGLDVTTIGLLPEADIQADYNKKALGVYDAIWCAHCLEHQRNVGSFLEKIFSELKDGGVLCVTVPPLKTNIVGGHLTLWNGGLLLYNLILAGFDCAKASIIGNSIENFNNYGLVFAESGSGGGRARVIDNHVGNVCLTAGSRAFSMFNTGHDYINFSGNTQKTGDGTITKLVNISGNANLNVVIRDNYGDVMSIDNPPQSLQFHHTRVHRRSAAPTTLAWGVGDIVYNTAPASGTPMGWICTVAGTPGTWVPFGDLKLSATTVWDPGSLADGDGETSSDITVTGAALGDLVLVGAPYDLQGITCNGYVSAINTVKIRIQNETGGTIDLASGTWNVRVMKA